MWHASWMSLGMMVTLLAWIAHKLGVFKESDQVCFAGFLESCEGADLNQRSILEAGMISHTRHWKGSCWMRRFLSSLLWIIRVQISSCSCFRALVPGVFLFFFLGSTCFLGTFPTVFFGAPPVGFFEGSSMFSSWMVSVRTAAAPGHAPDISLMMGSLSPSNGFKLTNGGPDSTREVSRGSPICLSLDGSA